MTYRLVDVNANSAAIFLAVLFSLFQIWTAGYGTHINDLPYIHDYHVSDAMADGSALDRPLIVGSGSTTEVPDRWILRFKLYSVDADEMLNLMGLARVDPAHGKFDPHLYQYGTAWLYPLGAWYAALDKIGVIKLGSLKTLLADPQRVSNIYYFGRVFVILVTAAAGLALFAALREITTPSDALLGVALFFVCPATISFSLTMKPHWYALFFVNLILLSVVRGFVRKGFSRRTEAVIGLLLGLAVGCAFSFGSFAILVWGAMVFAVRRGVAHWASLVRIPAISTVVLVASNPFIFLNYFSANAEAQKAADWFTPHFGLNPIASFAWNSLIPGFGIFLVVLFMVVALRELARPTFPGSRFFLAGILTAFALAAIVTANLSQWPVNYRYVAYTLPCMILFVAAVRLSCRRLLLAAALVSTIVQAVPLKLAYLDENDPVHGTRLAAARWIDDEISPGTGVCVGTPTPAPYNTPPFNLGRYNVNAPDCSYLVRVERYEVIDVTPQGFIPVMQFRPRLSVPGLALVFGHINPQITIYHRI